MNDIKNISFKELYGESIRNHLYLIPEDEEPEDEGIEIDELEEIYNFGEVFDNYMTDNDGNIIGLVNINDDMKKELIKMEEKKKNRVWEVLGEGTYKPSNEAVTIEKIPSGYYSLHHSSNIGTFIKNKSFITDEYIDLPIPEFKEIMNDIDKFWNIRDRFDSYGFIHKRGILLYGRQGTGKSFLMSALINTLINVHKGIVFSVSTSYELDIFSDFFTTHFRAIENERPVIVTIEDIDGLMNNKENETKLLNILDGLKHTSNIVYLATTNHIEQLEERISNRPSRFDRRYHIGDPSPEVRKVFIENKLRKEDRDQIDVDMWVDKTEGFSLSHIKELIVSVVIYGNTFDHAIKYLKEMMDRPITDIEWNANSKKSAGFVSYNGNLGGTGKD